jgi:rubrerythrin
MTRHTSRDIVNRTGLMLVPERGRDMVTATREFSPSSAGSAQAIAEVRVSYAQQIRAFGEGAARDGSASDDARETTVLMDKLGERLAFEHAGARLYEALVSKHQAYGDFAGGPGAQDLMEILSHEYQHADMLQQAISDLGGDPTAVTPSANVAANVAAGLPQVLTDPQTNLLQCLEAIMVAELTDNECWTVLSALARRAGHEELADVCRQALAHEREHLRKVRRWIAAGQGRSGGDERTESEESLGDDAGGAEEPVAASETEATAEEFTFTKDSPADREGYAISEEEAEEAGDVQKSPDSKPPKSRRRK